MAILQKGILRNSPLATRWVEDYGQRHCNCVKFSLHFPPKQVRFTTALSISGRVSLLKLDAVAFDMAEV